MSQDLACVFEGLNLIGALYLSGFEVAKHLPTLQSHHIRAVVTAAKEILLEYPTGSVEKHLHLQIQDHEQFQIQSCLDKAFDFIEQTRKHSNVLIHSRKGDNRSVAIIMGYLIRKYNYSLPQIYALFKRKTSTINLNQGLIEQLQKYSIKYGIYSQEFDLPTSNMNSQSKIKFHRSVSLVNSTKSSLGSMISSQGSVVNEKKSIESQFLNLKCTKNSLNDVLQSEQKQKIDQIYKQRLQIERKLKSLRRGLIRGKINKKTSIETLIQSEENCKRNQTFRKNAIIENTQNTQNDPNISNVRNHLPHAQKINFKEPMRQVKQQTTSDGYSTQRRSSFVNSKVK